MRLTRAELASVAAAADRQGLAVGAWLGQLACRAAAEELPVVPLSWAELVREIVRHRPALLALIAALEIREPSEELPQLLAEAQVLVRRLDGFLDAVMAEASL